MDITQLKTFVTVAEEEHLTRAAERLYTSQPAVSAQLKALEEELGVTLFDRTPKGMRLTRAGNELLSRARSILDGTRELLTHARKIQGQLNGHLQVGLNSDPEFLRLGTLVSRFQDQAPAAELSFSNSMSADILVDIRKGTLDSGYFFGPCPTSDLHPLHLADVPLAIIAPVAWAAEFCRAELAELAVMRWVYTTRRCPFFVIADHLFQHHSFRPERVVFVDSEDAICALVKSESGIALVRESDALRAQNEGWGCRWEGDLPSIALHLAVQKRRLGEPLIKLWLQLHEEIWATGAAHDDRVNESA